MKRPAAALAVAVLLASSGALLASVAASDLPARQAREADLLRQSDLAASHKASDGWVEVWARPLSDGTMAAGLFNRGPEPAVVTAAWADLGLSGPQPVRDIWLQKDLGRYDKALSATVPRHGVLFVKIGTPKAQTRGTGDTR